MDDRRDAPPGKANSAMTLSLKFRNGKYLFDIHLQQQHTKMRTSTKDAVQCSQLYNNMKYIHIMYIFSYTKVRSSSPLEQCRFINRDTKPKTSYSWGYGQAHMTLVYNCLITSACICMFSSVNIPLIPIA